MPILENIHAVGFDAFGTLIEGENTVDEYHLKLIKRYGGDVSQAQLLTRQYPTDAEGYFEKTFRESGIDFDKLEKTERDTLLEEYYTTFNNYQVIPRSEEILNTIKKQVEYIFLISNLSSLYVPVVQKLGLEQYFDEVFYSCDMGEKKMTNSPELFRTVYQRLESQVREIEPEQVLYTGDNIANDIRAPRKIGFSSMHINDFRESILNSM